MTIISSINPQPDQPYLLFPLRHNWSTAWQESWEYKTDVLVSGAGREQRRAVRWEPRRTFVYTCNYKDGEKYRLDRFFDQSPGKLAYFPIENRVIRTQGMAKQALNMRIYGPAPSWLKVGMTVMLREPDGGAETRVVSAFSDTLIVFTEKNDTVFSGDCRILATDICRADPAPSSTRLIQRAGTISVTATVDPNKGQVYVPGTTGQYFIGVREYMNYPIDWGGSPQVTHAYNRDDIDYGYGPIETFVPYEYPSRQLKASYWEKTLEESTAIVDFFHRMKGAQREFLLPSYERQIPYVAAAQGTKAILIDGLDFAYSYMNTTVYRRIVIKLKTGEDIHCQIDYIEALVDTNTSVIWLTEELPDTPLAPEDTNGIWWVTVARFASDRLDIDWLTSGVAQFAYTFQNLENFDV